MNARRLQILGFIAVATLALAGFTGNWGMAPIDGLDPQDPRVTLRHVEDEVDRRWGVATIVAGDLDKHVAVTGAVVFDVREAEEYEAGHIPGAIRVDPDISAEAFYAAHGDRLAGRSIILYCSVGARSSQLAKRLQVRGTAPGGSGSVLNLRGGVFRWVADGRPLAAASAPGRLHPYDSNWEQVFVRTLATE